MRTSSAVCDVHQTQPLKRVKLVSQFPFACTDKFITEEALCCVEPKCHRHYTADYGYFFQRFGDRRDFGSLQKKPQCRHHPQMTYLFLMRTDDALVWACQEEDCETTEPYTGVIYLTADDASV